MCILFDLRFFKSPPRFHSPTARRNYITNLEALKSRHYYKRRPILKRRLNIIVSNGACDVISQCFRVEYKCTARKLLVCLRICAIIDCVDHVLVKKLKHVSMRNGSTKFHIY